MVSVVSERDLYHKRTHLNILGADEGKTQEPPTSSCPCGALLLSPLWPGLKRDLKHPMRNRCQPAFLSRLPVMGGWGKGTETGKERIPPLPLASPKLPLKQEGQQKNAVAPRIMARGKQQLRAPSLWGSGTLPLNLKIQAGGLHFPTPTLLNAKCFMGRGEWGREKRTSLALRKKEAKLGLVVLFSLSTTQRPAGSRCPK